VLFQSPKKAIAILQPLIEQYPDVPQLYNYLHIAYQSLGDRDNAQRVLKETLERFPDYLFGRIAYATDCLQRGEPEKVPEIFDGKFELKLLYPERKRFHLSEVLGFYSVMAWYFHTQGEPDRAETYYELMRQLDPKHRNTQFIKRLLYPSRLDTLLGGLLNREP
jgi:tetratricopeptide (TPR) repeat protein